jgi:uncharacterized protein YukE
MSKAHVDPSELRRFASDLNRFNTELGRLVSTLHSRMRSLEATWRDQEQKKFAEEFDQTAKLLGISWSRARSMFRSWARRLP